jgi:hypothetical protein
MAGYPVRQSMMNLSKNLYVFMLALLMVASGCLGSGSSEPLTPGEEEVGSTVNYWNNTTVVHNTTVIHWNNTTTIVPEHEVMAAAGAGGSGVALVTINQSAGEAIHLVDATGSWTITPGNSVMDAIYLRVYTNCTNGMAWYEHMIETYDSHADRWLAGAGLECTHELQPDGQSGTDFEERLSVVFERRVVTVV